MKTRLFHYISYVTIALAFGFLVWIFFTIFYPIRVVELHKSPFKILTTTVQRGEYVEYEIEFTKYLNIKPKATYALVDGIVITLSGGSISRGLGPHHIQEKRQIPTSILPGIYRLHIDLEYEYVPWRKLQYSWISEPFEVL